MSNKQSEIKKQWLKERLDEGLVFYRSEEGGKCFIEYIPAENAWVPIDAPDYIYIDCLWVSGSMKGHGYSNELLDECIRDGKARGKRGLCIISSSKRKQEFLSDPKFLAYKGFRLADEAGLNNINLMYYPLTEAAQPPRFKECAKKGSIPDTGYVIYYTDQCPFTYYWVPRVAAVAKEYGIEVKTVHVTDRQTAQSMPVPVTTYALFKDGKYITHGIQSDKKFLAREGITL